MPLCGREGAGEKVREGKLSRNLLLVAPRLPSMTEICRSTGWVPSQALV